MTTVGSRDPFETQTTYTAAALAPDASLLVAVDSAQPRMQVMPVGPSGRRLDVTLDRGFAGDVKFGQSSSIVAVGFLDGAVELLSTQTGKRLLSLPAPAPCPSELARPFVCIVSVNFWGTLASGRLTVTYGKRTRTWNLERGAAHAEQDLVTRDVGFSDLFASGRQLVDMTYTTSGNAGALPTIHVFGDRRDEWVAQRSFAVAPIENFISESISPDTHRLVESTVGGMTMYDLTTGKKVWTVSAATGDNAWFSADGQRLYTNPVVGAVSVWSAVDGTFLFTLNVTPNASVFDIVDVAGRLRVAALDGQRVELTDWQLDQPHLVDAACAVANRNLTAVEWAQYVGNFDPYVRTCATLP